MGNCAAVVHISTGCAARANAFAHRVLRSRLIGLGVLRATCGPGALVRGLGSIGRFAVMNRRQRGAGKPETIDFPGFMHYCTTTRRGRFRLGRKPVAKRVNRTLARIDEVLRKRWHHDIWEVGRWLGRVCEGWLNYFAVPGSSRFIRTFLHRLQRLWMRALRRRSQRARFGWRRLEHMTEILWPRASLRHPWPDQRFAVNHPR